MIEYVDIIPGNVSYEGMTGWAVFSIPDGRCFDLQFEYCAVLDYLAFQVPPAYALFELEIRDYANAIRKDARDLVDETLAAATYVANASMVN